MSGEVLERVVGSEEAGERADVLLAAWLGESRSQAQERFSGGHVRIDGAPVAKARRLVAGERVVVSAPQPEPAAPPPPPVPVRYADEDLLVVAKPAGLVVHPGAGVPGGTLVDALRAMGVRLAGTGDPRRPGIVHRLDRGTSGLLLVAKTQAAADGLASALQRRAVKRSYWAIVEGVPAVASATIDAPIGRAPDRGRFRVDAGGRPAVTHYDVEETFGGVATVAVRLETGRTHQIRVHLSAVGHPVAGDREYGASPALRARLRLGRPALHARRLAFTHPVTGAPVTVEEPLPDDLSAALAVLRGDG